MINKLLYNLNCCRINIIINRFFSLLTLFALFLGLLFPTAIVGLGRYITYQLQESYLVEPENLAIMAIDSNQIPEEEIDEIIESNEGVLRIVRSAEGFITAISGEAFSIAKFIAIDHGYDTLFKTFVNNGTWLSKDNYDNLDNKCVIGRRIGRKLCGRDILGKTVNINGENFEIIGVTDNFEWSGSILFPLAAFEARVFKPENYDYYIHISSNIGSDTWAEFCRLITTRYGNCSISFLYDLIKEEMNETSGQIAFILLISLVVLAYSMINIVTVIFLKVDDTRRRIAVYTAFGATRGDIFLQNLFEMLLLSLSGIILVIASMPLVSFAFNRLSLGIKTDWQVILQLAAISIALSISLSLGLVSRILKKSIAETFREAIVK